MGLTGRWFTIVLLVLGVQLHAEFSRAATADQKATPPPKTGLPATVPHFPKATDNLSVVEVWIGGPWPDRWGHLDRPVRHDERVSLVCRVAVSGSVQPGWKLRWIVDGKEYCGSGDLQQYPPCYFEWPSTEGDDAYMSFWSTVAGRHTFQCVADSEREVKESSERDNSKRVLFEVEPLATLPLEQIPELSPPRGPQLRRFKASIHPR